MHRYVSLRRRLHSVLDELHMYDLYVPVVEGVEMKFTFDEAKEIALKALAPLGEEYLEPCCARALQHWLDRRVRESRASARARTRRARACTPLCS